MPSPLSADVAASGSETFWSDTENRLSTQTLFGHLLQEHASGQAERYRGFLFKPRRNLTDFDTAQAIGLAVGRC
jgi:hypothetical protein